MFQTNNTYQSFYFLYLEDLNSWTNIVKIPVCSRFLKRKYKNLVKNINKQKLRNLQKEVCQIVLKCKN